MTLDLEPSVELTAGGVVLYIPAVTARLLLTPTQARDLAASLCAAADAHDDEYRVYDPAEIREMDRHVAERPLTGDEGT